MVFTSLAIILTLPATPRPGDLYKYKTGMPSFFAALPILMLNSGNLSESADWAAPALENSLVV